MKWMSEKKAAQMRAEYENLSQFDKRYVQRIIKDNSEIATKGKMAAVFICGILSLLILIYLIYLIVWFFRTDQFLVGILMIIPAFFLLAAVFCMYAIYRVKRRCSIEGATECLLEERKYKEKHTKSADLANRLREKHKK